MKLLRFLPALTTVVVCVATTNYVSPSPKLYAISCILTALSFISLFLCLLPDDTDTKKCRGKLRAKVDRKNIVRSTYPHTGSYLQYLRGYQSFNSRLLFITMYNNPRFYKKHKKILYQVNNTLWNRIRKEITNERT